MVIFNYKTLSQVTAGIWMEDAMTSITTLLPGRHLLLCSCRGWKALLGDFALKCVFALHHEVNTMLRFDSCSESETMHAQNKAMIFVCRRVGGLPGKVDLAVTYLWLALKCPLVKIYQSALL